MEKVGLSPLLVSLDCHADDPDIIVRFVCLGIGLHVAQVLHHLDTLEHSPEHCMLVVQPWLKEDKNEEHEIS